MPFDGNWTEQRANVEKLARALEKSETFNMADYDHGNDDSHSCGTPACIAGHAIVVLGVRNNGTHGALHPHMWDFAEKIGLSYEKLDVLCHSYAAPALGGLDADQITGPMAAAALRRLADTGEAYFSLDDA